MGFEFPPDIAVLKQAGRVGARHCCFDRLGISYPGEIHRGPDRPKVPIDHEGRPLAHVRRVGQGLPDFFPRVAQFPDENKRPLISVLSYALRPAGRTRRVRLTIDHLSSPWLPFSVAWMGPYGRDGA